VGLDVVDVDEQVLGVGPAHLAGALAKRVLVAGVGHHDEVVRAVLEFRVLDQAVLAVDPDADHEPERLAQPRNDRARVLVHQGRRDARPADGRWVHGGSFGNGGMF
jgi:hypothetical protein